MRIHERNSSLPRIAANASKSPGPLTVLLITVALAALASCGGEGGGSGGSENPPAWIIYHVSLTGDDANPGSETEPMLSINAAVLLAASKVSTGEVRVSSGTYDPVVMAEGISLFGGYATDWSARDPATYVTIIENGSNTGGTVTDPNSTVSGSSGITTTTVIDGFTINGSGGSYSAAIFNVGASPTISNNIISGGTAATGTYGIYNKTGSQPLILDNTIDGGNGDEGHGIFNLSASPTIRGNTITGGGTTYSYGIQSNGGSGLIENNPLIAGSTVTFNSYGVSTGSSNSAQVIGNVIYGGDAGNRSYGVKNASTSITLLGNTIDGGTGTTWSYGVFNSSSSPQIRNNTIYGGTTAGTSTGIYIAPTNSAPTIQNNTIDGGSGGGASQGIRIFNTLPGAIENNIISTSGGTNRYCVEEGNDTSDPASLRNNDLWDCPTALYRDEGATNLTTDILVNGLGDITSSGNIANIDPAFVNRAGGDWHLKAATPSTVRQGGLDLSAFFTKDKDDVARTASWSMGAYEHD